MTITHEQRAEIGNAYLTEIKRRIAVRTAAKDKINESRKLDLTAQCAKLVKRMFREATDVSVYKDDGSLYRPGPNLEVIEVSFSLLGKVRGVAIDRSLFPELAAHAEANKRVRDSRAALCKELEFLTQTAMAPSCLSGFQAHAARLMSLKSGESAKAAVGLIDDFLTSKRGFVCAI